MSRPPRLILTASAVVALLVNPILVHAQVPVITGLQLWFDAADASTIDLDGSNNVTEWRDKSGNGTHMTEATGSVTLPGYSPNVQNGRAAVEFRDRDALENADVTLSNLPTTQDRTIFAALSPKDNTDSQNWYFSYGQPVDAKWNLMMLFNHGGGWRNFFVGAGSQEILATVGAVSVPGPATIIEYGYGAPNSHSFLNDGNLDFQGGSGAAPTPLDTNLTNGARLGVGVDAGVSNQSNYDFFELLVYDRALDENERNQVGNYLQAKWDIDGSYVPEPSSMALLLLCSGTALLYRRRRRATM